MLAKVSPSSGDSPPTLARVRPRGWGGTGGAVRIQLAPSFSPQGNLGGAFGPERLSRTASEPRTGGTQGGLVERPWALIRG